MKNAFIKTKEAVMGFFKGLFNNAKAGTKNVGKLSRAIASGFVDTIKGIIEVASATMETGEDAKTAKTGWELIKMTGKRALGAIISVMLIYVIFAIVLPAMVLALSKIALYIGVACIVIALAKYIGVAGSRLKEIISKEKAIDDTVDAAAAGAPA